MKSKLQQIKQTPPRGCGCAQREVSVRQVERRQPTVCTYVAMWHNGIDTVTVNTQTQHDSMSSLTQVGRAEGSLT